MEVLGFDEDGMELLGTDEDGFDETGIIVGRLDGFDEGCREGYSVGRQLG